MSRYVSMSWLDWDLEYRVTLHLFKYVSWLQKPAGAKKLELNQPSRVDFPGTLSEPTVKPDSFHVIAMKTGALICRCARCQESMPAAGQTNKKQISPTKKSHGIKKWAEAVAHSANLTHIPGYSERNKEANFPPHLFSYIERLSLKQAGGGVLLPTGRVYLITQSVPFVITTQELLTSLMHVFSHVCCFNKTLLYWKCKLLLCIKST